MVIRACLRGSILALLCALPVAVSAQPVVSATATPAAVKPPDDPELSEVIVLGREPRYVAPTTRDRIGRVWVPVHINERGPFRLVLDSGASHSAVIQSVATQLNLSTAASPQVLMRGVTGSAVRPTIQADSISVGDLWVGPAMLPIVEDAFGGAEGLLGTDGMQDKRVFIDFRNDFINISRSRNRRAAEGFQSLPFIKSNQRLLMVNAHVGTLPVRAIIDTGAQSTIGNLALQDALRRQISNRPRGKDEIHGATGDIQFGQGAMVSPIILGALEVRDAHVTFGEMHIFEHWGLGNEPAILIGMDILGLLDTLVIDYQRKELHLKSRQTRQRPF
jgi:predicted aspartyl protease